MTPELRIAEVRRGEAIPVTVLYPLDPIGPKVGGSVTFIRGLMRHAPPEFQIRFIGVTCDASERPPRRWSSQEMGGRCFEFYPLFHEPEEDRLRMIPLSLRFVLSLACLGIEADGAVLVHNRPETALARGTRRHGNVVFVHNDVPAQVGSRSSEVRWSRFPLLYYALERRVFALVNQVYTVSSNTLADYQRRFPKQLDKVQFIPTWVDTTLFAPAAEPRRTLRERLIADGMTADPAGTWVLFSGRLQKQKAPERLVDAFAALRQRRPDTHLLVVGEGDLRAVVEKRVQRLGLSGSVHLLGPVRHAATARYYQAADVLLLTSNFEGMPMSVLEALACGLPVVTTDVGEVKRVVIPGETGEISRDFSAEGIADALERVLERRDRYHAQRCVEAVQLYSPTSVLAPVYARIAQIASLQAGARRAGPP